MARVTTIPASINAFTRMPNTLMNKKKVAGYARVSTDNEEQLTSYTAQVDYYTNYIKDKLDWEFINVYTDEGISGTNTSKREGFNKMITDALDGKIDLIVTKSVSRFARNTVDSLTTVRKLKDNGIEVYFEKENIWTLDSKGELLITIMSSLAQEESRSISENVKWGHRKRFADGQVYMPFKNFLGYERGENGEPVVNEEQAKLVRRIYKMFLEGITPHSIAKTFNKEEIKTPMGKTKWSPTTIRNILKNEKYKGDALLQKNFTPDFLTKKQKKNQGEVQQYYVENSHEGIISKEVFEMVQQELEKRSTSKNKYSGVNIFSSKIKCAECGNLYGSKVWHSNSKYKRVIYQCNHKFKEGSKCRTPHLYESEIKKLFVKAMNEMITNKDEIIKNIEMVSKMLFDDKKLIENKDIKHQELTKLIDEMQTMINTNATVVSNQVEYQNKYSKLANEYEKVRVEYEELEKEIGDNVSRGEMFKHFINTLKEQDSLVREFDESLWGSLLEGIEVRDKGGIEFIFRDGSRIEIKK